MLRSSLASLVLATLCVSSSSAAHAKTCIRDLAGQIVCGELVETRDEPDQAGSPAYTRPPPQYYDGHREPGVVPHYYRPPQRDIDRPIYGRSSSGRPETWFRPYRNQVGALACAQPGYTVQDGVCKRYRGY